MGSCSRHNYNSTYKRRKKRKCDCPRWSYNQKGGNSIYVLSNPDRGFLYTDLVNAKKDIELTT
ncbi:MAG: hypothetical protein B6I19_09185 [Bacteroidetes bacterium 4572_114]|nr:MAG: hypothetical protein B6I19_09185 [Bacteroidetes bacterium 4572_114]